MRMLGASAGAARRWLTHAAAAALVAACGGEASRKSLSVAGGAPGAPVADGPRALVLQLGHAGRVYSGAFSPSGDLLATGDATGAILLTDPATGVVKARLAGHSANVTCLEFSRDGARLASGGEDGRAIVWDLARARPLSSSKLEHRKVWGVALSPDGAVLGVRDNVGVVLRDAESGEPRHTIDSASGYAFGFSPDGRSFLVAGGTDVLVVDVATGAVRARLPHAKMPRDARFTRDGAHVLTAGGSARKLAVFSLDGQKERELPTSGDAVAVDSDDAGALVAVACGKDGVDVFDLRTGRPGAHLPAAHASEWFFGLSADGKTVFAADAPGRISAYDARGGAVRGSADARAYRRMAVDRARGRAVLLGDDDTVEVWDGARVVARLDPAHEAARSAALAPDGQTLLVVREGSGVVYAQDLATGRVERTYDSGLSALYQAVPSPDGRYLAATGYGETVIFERTTGGVAKRITAGRSWSSQHQVAFGAGGRLAHVGLDDHTVSTFGRDLAPAARLDVGRPAPTALAYSPDGATLALAGPAGVELWRDGLLERRLSGHRSQAAYGLAWSPDGQALAVASESGFLLVDAASGEARALSGAHGFVTAAFSPDGRLVATAERDGTVTLLDRQGAVVQSLHDRDGTPWSLAFLPDTRAPVLLFASRDVRALRVHDGQAVTLRAFEVDGRLVGLAASDAAASGDDAALARVSVRASPDVRAPLAPLPAAARVEGLAAALGR